MLDGVTVLDFTRYLPGPFATLRLQDWGATVIKVEDPSGDPGRYLNRSGGAEGSLFRTVNRGKRGVVANLKDPDDRKMVQELAMTADVVLEGFRPGGADRLGVGYETLTALNPALVYVSLSGYGQDGPNASLSGHDLNYQAMSGLLDQLLDANGEPIKPKIAIADLIGGLVASEAMLAGLVKRGRTGTGCYMDVSVTEAVLSILGLHVTHRSIGGGLHGTEGNSISYNIYRTKDARYVTLGALEPKFWAAWCDGVGAPELVESKNSAPEPGNPAFVRVTEIFASRTLAEWVEFSESVDCCLAPVLNIDEVIENAGFRDRGIIADRWGGTYVATHFVNRDEFLTGEDPFPQLGS